MHIKYTRFLAATRLSVALCFATSPVSQAATFAYFPSSQSDQPILRMKTNEIPTFLAKKTFKSYVEAYTALKRTHLFAQDPGLAKARRSILNLMEKGQLEIKGEGFDLLCTDQDFGIPQLILHGEKGEVACFRTQNADRGGAFLRLPFLPHMTLTPLSFSEMDGKVSWILLEYLLDRYTDLERTETLALARSCFSKRK